MKTTPKNKNTPKLTNMTEKERKAWESKLGELGQDNRDAANKIIAGKGWIF